MKGDPRDASLSRRVTRRDALKIGAGAVASLTGGLTFGRSPVSADGRGTRAIGRQTPPNVVLIITDQQHRDTIAALGCRYAATPGQDRLVEAGVSFLRCYSSNPICSPARSSIFTGRMASETGVWTNGLAIHPSVPNIGQWLSEQAGYETVYTGKWHLPGSRTPSIPGFRVPVTGLGGQGNLGDTSVSLACEGFLRNRTSDAPFLLVASFLQPHDICQWLRTNQANVDEVRYPEITDELPPLPDNFAIGPDEAPAVTRRRQGNEPVPGGWSELHWRYYRWSYFRMIEQVDAEIGRVLRALEESGQAGSTLVLVVSDHGEGMGHHQMVRKNFLYDEAAAVPLLVSFPGRARAGAVDDRHPVSQLDIVPTICDYAGVEAPPLQRGQSLRPLLEGEDLDREFIVSEISAGPFARMVRTERHKYLEYIERPSQPPYEQLFDMIADPGETTNLVGGAEAAGTLGEHRRMLAQWEASLELAPGLPEDRVWPKG